VGLRPNPTFQADMQSELQRRSSSQVVNKALYNALDSCKRLIFCCKSMAQPIPQALSHLVALNVELSVLICSKARESQKAGKLGKLESQESRKVRKARKAGKLGKLESQESRKARKARKLGKLGKPES
jgi:hypothetical protein